MSVTVTGTTQIAASARDVIDVIVDVAAYPTWLDGVRRADVVAEDAQGRPHQAQFVIATPMGNLSYTVEYVYALEEQPQQIRWTLVSGTMIRQLDGAYEITAEAASVTRIDTELRLEVDLPLPQSLVHNAATAVVQQGLDGLQRRCATGRSSHDGE